MYSLFIVTGLSGAGKTSLMDELLLRHSEELNMKQVVSYTTRPRREHETDGEAYKFISEEEFEELNNENFFLNTLHYNGNYYGTPKTVRTVLENESNLMIVTDLTGAFKLKSLFPKNAKLIFVRTPTLEEAKKRIITRGSDCEESVKYRCQQNENDLEYYLHNKGDFAYSVNNDKFSNALQDLIEFIKIPSTGCEPTSKNCCSVSTPPKA